MKVQAHSPNARKIQELIALNPPSVIKLGAEDRKWQPKAYEKCKDSRFAFIISPCGSGKTPVLVNVAVYGVVESKYTQKQLGVVSQQHLSDGFSNGGKYIQAEVEGETYQWDIKENNFCDPNSKDVRRRFKQWLITPGYKLALGFNGKVISGLNAIVSHQTLGIVWEQLTASEKKKAIKKLTLIIDEAHHVKGIFENTGNGMTEEEKQDAEEASNNLGKVCRYIINSRCRTSKIRLATATPFRTEGIIMCDKAKEKFDIFYTDWLEHWHSLGISDFELSYGEYRNMRDMMQQIYDNIIADGPGHWHYITMPPTGQKWRKTAKETKIFIRFFKKHFPGLVLDLVTPSTQKRNKDILLDEPKRGNPGDKESKFKIVITCMLGREGTDWCPCSRLHNTACENSLNLATQTLGRTFRRFFGKDNVHARYYVPEFTKPKKGITKRELFSDRTNALLVCMQVDEHFHPIIMPAIRSKDDSKKREKSELSILLGESYTDIRREMIEECETLAIQGNATADYIDLVIDDIIGKYKITDRISDVRDGLRLIWLRALKTTGATVAPKDMGIDVAFIRKAGFDKIIEEHGLSGRSLFFAEFDEKDWDKIKKIVNEGISIWDFVKEYNRTYPSEVVS